MARGGKRTPRDPAPVSGPGKYSQRTDGGPTQPVRDIPNQPYGDRQALSQLQAAAPMPASPSTPTGGGGTPGPVPAYPDGIFGPTQRPSEPNTAGLDPYQNLPSDTDYLLRLMYTMYPHPDLARLINQNTP